MHLWITNQCHGYQLLVTNHPKTQWLKQYFFCLPPPCSSIWAGLSWAQLLSSRWCWPCGQLVAQRPWGGWASLSRSPSLSFSVRWLQVAPPAGKLDRLHGSSELPRVSSSNGQAFLTLKPRTSTALYWLKHHRPSPDSGRGSGTRAWNGRYDSQGTPE